MLLLASISDSIVEVAVNVVGDLGLAGVFFLMALESACIPIPSEATMLFAGFNVSQGRYSLAAIVVLGVLGNLVGSWIAYGVGYAGRVDLLERHGRKLHIQRRHLDAADRWFARYGSATVFFTRMLPIIRTFISLPAGAARMPFWRFTALTLAGCIPWVLVLAVVGEQTGSHWAQWRHSLGYVDYLVVVAVVLLAAFVIVRARRRTRAAAETV